MQDIAQITIAVDDVLQRQFWRKSQHYIDVGQSKIRIHQHDATAKFSQSN